MTRVRSPDTVIHADTLVIGAGPSGLMCAISAAVSARRVIALEKNRGVLVKLALSGAGRCNITHAGPIEEFPSRYGGRGRFVKPALLQFTNDDLAALLAGRGVETVAEEDGRVFPVTRDPGDVRKALLAECAAHGVEIRCEEPVRSVSAAFGRFEIATDRSRYRAGSLVIATGGRSYPRTGSTGDGYRFARRFGHAIVETTPALAPVIVRQHRFAVCAGISIERAGITLIRGGKTVRGIRGDVLFTHRGLSGPGILDLSRHVRRGDMIALSLGGFERAEELREAFDACASSHGRRSVKSCLTSLRIPERLVKRVLELAGIDPSLRVSQAGRETRNLIAARLTRLEFDAARLGSWDEAMVTRGGVDTARIDRRTMESHIVTGLYVVGETLDVDGDSGGYNLQWAFSSGAAAGRAIASRPATVTA